MIGSDVGLSGEVSMRVVGPRKAPLSWRIRNMLRRTYIWGVFTVFAAKLFSKVTGIPTMTARLRVVVRRLSKAEQKLLDELEERMLDISLPPTEFVKVSDQIARIRNEGGELIDYGWVSHRVVTDAGVNAIVDAFQNTFEVETFNFHGIGTGSAAEAVGDTALGNEIGTEYDPDNTRATGTQGEGASANIYQSQGTNTVDAAIPILEHGLFDQASTAGGTLLDRSVFAVINLSSGDSLQSTYELTVNSGS